MECDCVSMLGMTAVIIGRGASKTCAGEVPYRRSPAHTFSTGREVEYGLQQKEAETIPV